MSFNAAVLLALIPFAANLVSAATVAPVFAGCLTAGSTPSGTTTYYDPQTAEACASTCWSDQGAIYSYFDPSQTYPCQCSNSAVKASTYVASGAAAYADAQCSTDQITYYVSASTYTFQGCHTGLSNNPSLANGVQGSSIESCLQLCDGNKYTVVYPNNNGDGTFGCECFDQALSYSDDENCAQNALFAYSHTAGTTVGSGYARRQLKERLERARRSSGKDTAQCPSPLSACKVTGQSSAFECIDTQLELESCGGCINGNFNDNKATNAVDCTALPGVASGGVTCHAGKCRSYRCEDGYKLSNHTCIAN